MIPPQVALKRVLIEFTNRYILGRSIGVSVIRSFGRSVGPSFVRSFVRSVGSSFVRSFIRSIVRSVGRLSLVIYLDQTRSL